MAYSYKNSFALIDNPFGPTKPLEGIRNRNLMKMLVNRPLRIYEEPKLLDLYSPEIGTFEKNMNKFMDLLKAAGYSNEPASAGLNPFIFLIMGYKGTGKTTLANVMLHWLQQCRPNAQSKWHIFQEWPDKEFSSHEEQIKAISELEDKIIKDVSENGYCCAVIDNLIAGAELKALEMFNNLNKDRIAFLFLITSDLEILKKTRDNSKHNIHRLRTKALSPEDAVKFVKHRISYFRAPDVPHLNENYFFPFDDDDIREAVRTGIISSDENGSGIITLRQLSVILDRIITTHMIEIDDNFNIAEVTKKRIPGHLIRIVPYFERLVA